MTTPQDLLSRYRKTEKIGEGTYGIVYKAVDESSGRNVALKKIRLDPDENQGILPTTLREISLLINLEHDNVVTLYDVVQSDKSIHVVYELLDQDLKSFIDISSERGQVLPLPLVKSYMYQIIKGLAYCHSSRVLHRDLKPQNLLIDNQTGRIKLADFGLSRPFGNLTTTLTQEVVTLWYRAPEIILGHKYYGSPVDVWSVGCIFAELVTLRPLFPGDSEIDVLHKIFNVLGTPNEQNWPGVSQLKYFNTNFPKWNENCLRNAVPQLDDLGIDLLRKMLTYSPSNRITAREALSHPFFEDLIKNY
ncbi:cyclin-dependent kinase CDC2 [Acrasis kona]|uniref:cyclin-dependent kinase n=1 Tax=Acrasis kona TaxID=1008807 RepID=A0AAW2ZAR4_9EUKA